MKEIITILITSGGLGFANVIFLERVGALSFDNRINNDRYMWLLMFTALNYSVQYYSGKLWITILISLAVTVLMMLFNYRLENGIRGIFHRAPATDKHAWDDFWDSVGPQPFVIVFDRITNKVVDAGQLYSNSRGVDPKHEVALNTSSNSEGWLSISFEKAKSWAYEQTSKSSKTVSAVYIDDTYKYLAITIDQEILDQDS
jgi:hypothetical protein